MKARTAHWGAREWSRNLDDLVPDRARPQAFPSTYPMDLMGRIRVKLTVQDGNLVAYGFGGQKVVIPPASVGGIYTVGRFKFGKFISHERALIVVDRENRVLLRADGLWETYGEVKKVARAAKVGQVTHLYGGDWRRTLHASRGGTSYRSTSSRAVTRFTKARGYQRLRTHPRGSVLQGSALVVLCCLVMASCAFLGVVPSLLLPEWFGKVRSLIGIVGVVLGVAVGAWVFGALRHVWQDGLRWAGASWVAGGLAPLHRFFTRRREHEGTWLVFANSALIALFGLLVVFGPGTLVASASHGVRDSNLVAELRADGVTTRGALIDVPDIETDSNGNTTPTDVPTLAWGGDNSGTDPWDAENQVTDPSIGGRPLPLDADAGGTDVPETIVYLRGDPAVAAAAQQISGSVWHGAPTANVISGGIFTVALPPFFIFLVLHLRRLRWRRAKDMVDGLTAT